MHSRYAMMASSVTPPTEDEGVEEDMVVEAGEATVCVWGYLSLNYAVLYRTITASMAQIYEKWGDLG